MICANGFHWMLLRLLIITHKPVYFVVSAIPRKFYISMEITGCNTATSVDQELEHKISHKMATPMINNH